MSDSKPDSVVAALIEARGVIGSINTGPNHQVKIGGDICFWQREEWVRWAQDEVLPKINDALSAATQVAAVAPLDAMVLAAARELSPTLFEHGLDGLPGDGPKTKATMEKEAALVRRMLTAAALSAPQAEREGWKLVPVEITDAMALAATKVSLTYHPHQRPLNGTDVWGAMLAAAPPPQQGEAPDTTYADLPGWARRLAAADTKGSMDVYMCLKQCADAIERLARQAPAAVAAPDDVLRDAKRWRFASAPNGDGFMSWVAFYEDWNGEDDFGDFVDAAIAAQEGGAA